MNYIKNFDTFEEYETWMSIEENYDEAYRTEEKMCVDGIIISHTYKDFEDSIDEGDNE